MPDRVVRFFNTADPCEPERHYMLPAAGRLPGARRLFDQGGYFVPHAPRQTGKTTALRALAKEVTAEGKYTALYFSCKVAEAAGDRPGPCQTAILGEIHAQAGAQLTPELRPPAPWPSADELRLLRAALHAWAIELNVWPDKEGDPLQRGLDQLGAYLERCGLDHGALVIFDRRAGAAPVEERTQLSEAQTQKGHRVLLLRAQGIQACGTC